LAQPADEMEQDEDTEIKENQGMSIDL